MALGGDDKTQKIKEAFDCLLTLSSDELDSTVSMLRTEAFRRAFQKFKEQPAELEKRVLEVENAFCQLSQVKKVLSDPPKEVSAQGNKALESAKKSFTAKNFKEALSSCEEAINEGIQTEEVFLLSGTSALYAKELERADRYANEVLKRNLQNPHALVLKALSIKEKDAEKSLEYLERALKLRPDSGVIRGYRQQVLSLLGRHHDVGKTDPFGFRRKWLRSSLSRRILVSDTMSSFAQPYETASLSAGGCLVVGDSLPKEFRFSLELREFGKVWGLGRVSYHQKDGCTGVKFIDLGTQDQNKIDHEVRNAQVSRQRKR